MGTYVKVQIVPFDELILSFTFCKNYTLMKAEKLDHPITYRYDIEAEQR